MPTARIVTTPKEDTAQAVFVVPPPSAKVTSPPEDVEALIATLAEPNGTFEGWVNVMV